MRTHLVSTCLVAALVLFVVLPPVYAQDTATSDTSTPYQIQPYNDHLYKITTLQPFRVDIYASVGPDGVLLVDAGFLGTGHAFGEALRSLTDQPVKMVIATHSHADHITGIPILAPNAVVVADRNAVIDSYMALPPRRRFTNPTVTVDSALTIHFNGEDIHVVALPPGHAPDELLIHFTGSNVLCVGSRILPLFFPSVDNSQPGALDEILESIPRIVKEYPNATIASGHGPDLTGKQALDYYKEMKKSRKVVEKALKKGKTEDQLVEENVLAKWIDNVTFTQNSARLWIRAIGRGEGFFPAALPSISQPMTEAFVKSGAGEMIQVYQSLKKEHPDEYDFRQFQLNNLGYQFLFRNNVETALKVFQLNIEAYPTSANVYDSYGEALLAKGDTTQAITYYEKAIATDSTFTNAQHVLQSLLEGK